MNYESQFQQTPSQLQNSQTTAPNKPKQSYPDQCQVKVVQQPIQSGSQADGQWPQTTPPREYSAAGIASKPYTSTQLLFDINDEKRLVLNNNENAVNASDNNNQNNIIISELNNIGGHISGHKSTAQMADQIHNNDNLFSFVSRKPKTIIEDINDNDLEEEEEDDDDGDEDEDEFENRETLRNDGQQILREYTDDYYMDEYEREGEYDEESDDEEEEADILSKAGTTTVFGLSEFDRSLGEVYTIPEEEEDLISPQMPTGAKKTESREFKLATDNDLNSDTAATLHRWRGNH